MSVSLNGLSDKVATIEPSLTMSITALANKLKSEGKNVIGFGAGEPDFDTPDPIKQAAIQAIHDGKSKYTPAAGLPELKSAITNRLSLDYGVNYDPNQIVVSCGAKHSLHNAFLSILNPGDEVIVAAPYWVSYPEQIALTGATMTVVTTTAENDFKMTVSMLSEVVTSKTRAIVINSPSNPTGTVYSESELRALAEWAISHQLWIISDEIYDKLIYDGHHVSMPSLSDEIKQKTILINGVSKSYAMTGWRVGYLAAPLPIASAISRLQSHTTSNPTSIAQYAAIEAFTMDQSILDQMRDIFDQRRQRMIQQLQAMDGLSINSPQGAFYAFPSIHQVFGKSTKAGKKITNSMTFCEALLEDVNVACVPGIGFGSEGYLRLSYATADTNIDEGLNRMSDWLLSLQ